MDILHAVDVEADADTIYEAVSTGEGLRAFWTGDAEAEARVGSTAVFRFPAAPVDLKMRVEALERRTRVAWRCEGEFPYWKDTTVEWLLSASPGGHGTQLFFRHGGWPRDYPEIEYARVNWVWGQVVGRLKAYAESGKPEPFFPAKAAAGA
jgi:uncharacterized protein YndB with AHSA1/START domain